MSLLTFLLVLAVSKNYVIICNACSLLPGGSPPCFPNAVDYNANQAQKIKEISYKLAPNKEFRYNGHNTSNELLALGQRWQAVIGSDSDTVICDRNTNNEAYVKEFETKLMWRTGRHGTMDENDDIVSERRYVDDYFVITKREVWNCRGKEKAQTSSLSLLRIVTELLAFRNVKRLSWQDGIKVIFVPNLQIPRYGYEGKSIPIVREIKYLHPDSYKVLKYEGFLEFHQPEKEGKEEYSIFKEIHWNHPLFKQGNHFKEVYSTTDRSVAESDLQNTGTSSHETEDTRKVNLSYYGIDLVEMEMPSKTIGTLDEVAQCTKNAKDPNLYSATYLTQWSEESDLDEPFTDVYFRFNFVITKHELWTCETKGSREKFVRSILEYIGSVPLGSVHYTYKINIWKFFINLKEQFQSIAVRDISYFNEKSEHVSYVGWIKEA